MHIALRNHTSKTRRSAARPAIPFAITTAVLDAVAVSLWLLTDDGVVMYANACARAECGWQGTKPRPLKALSKALFFQGKNASDGITLADLHGMSRARTSALMRRGTILAGFGASRAVRLRTTRLATAEYGVLMLLSAEADTSSCFRSPATAARWAFDLAHHLNNIGASLMGFVELASEENPGNVMLESYLNEFRLVYSRLGRVAGSLELLSATRAMLQSMQLQDIPALQALSASASYEVHFSCDPRTRVRVNAETLRQTMVVLAAYTPPTVAGVAFQYLVERGSVALTCSGCGAAVASTAVQISSKAGRAKRDVFSAAVVNGAHRAGGHVQWHANSTRCIILFPVSKIYGKFPESAAYAARRG